MSENNQPLTEQEKAFFASLPERPDPFKAVEEVMQLRQELSSLRAKNERLRGALKKAHNAMFSWFSSEYAEHPLSVEVRKELESK